MSRERFGIMGATDGSAQARLAVSAAVACPWPAGARGDGVGARGLLVVTTEPFPPSLWRAVNDALQRAAARARAEPRRRVAGRPCARRRRSARGGHPARGAAPTGARDRGGVSRTRSPRPARPGQREPRRGERPRGQGSARATPPLPRCPRALPRTETPGRGGPRSTGASARGPGAAGHRDRGRPADVAAAPADVDACDPGGRVAASAATNERQARDRLGRAAGRR